MRPHHFNSLQIHIPKTKQSRSSIYSRTLHQQRREGCFIHRKLYTSITENISCWILHQFGQFPVPWLLPPGALPGEQGTGLGLCLSSSTSYQTPALTLLPAGGFILLQKCPHSLHLSEVGVPRYCLLLRFILRNCFSIQSCPYHIQTLIRVLIKHLF